MKKVNINEVKTTRADIDEAETTINIMRRDKVISIYTCDNTMLTKLKRVASKNPAVEIYEMSEYEGYPTGYTFIMPKKCLGIRTGLPKRKKKKEDIDETSED